jgi:hypothetical protein
MSQDRGLTVTVGTPRIIMRGANYPYMVRFADGSIVVSAHTSPEGLGEIRSTDGGETWKPWKSGARLGVDGSIGRLADGTVLVMEQKTKPAADAEPGTYVGERWVLSDNGNTLRGPEPITVRTPPIATGYDDGGADESNRVRGPFFHGDLLVLPNGDLLSTMDTNFPEDTKYPKTGAMYKWRTIVVRSGDQGRNWEYLSTAAAMDSIADRSLVPRWQDGFDEAALGLMPDGRLLCVMRTGTYANPAAARATYRDLSTTVAAENGEYRTRGQPTDPIYLAVSGDGGRTWGTPEPLPTARGACPRLLLLSHGVLALSYGRVARPTQGDHVVFSLDGGRTWVDDREIFAGLSSGYTEMIETAPGKILYVFDSVTAWGPKYAPDWIGAVDIEVAPLPQAGGDTAQPGPAVIRANR